MEGLIELEGDILALILLEGDKLAEGEMLALGEIEALGDNEELGETPVILPPPKSSYLPFWVFPGI